MDFRAKLGRLGAPPREAPAAAPAPGAERSGTLEDLRRQMSEILGRAPAPRAPPPDPTLGDLPFSREEGEGGPLHRRVVRHPRSHHVGRMPVDAALAAAPEVLALLGLDPALAGADPSGALYLDTETTGLGGAGTIAFLVGLASFEGGELVVEQLLLRTPAEELAMLHRIEERLRAATLVVTFNGKAFDLPTLAGRWVMSRRAPPPPRPHLDLLHVARRLHRGRIGACTLKAVESEVLGFIRGEDIDGAEVASRYGHYLRSGDPAALRAVVDHNAWDVVSMTALVGLYGEPLGALHGEDLVGLARTYRRARALDRAEEAAEAALSRGAGPEGLRVRGEIARARGDRQRALAEFEALSAVVDDARVRLELAKLYEHFVREPGRALDLVERGTGEKPTAAARRRARLVGKVRRSSGGGEG